ncbi:hypothetical protein L202_00712 [Cryptococcus amylolentus CBS 6039]|uniref:Major facilitator superfamily (MFS) profile domain-containing protein n=1 Tax=Cryptococcus amylolentus CBS 6039 TaxID=1295533 RepID=A0A1E3I8D5_9TREE|nr:hypothetical protein L202_00712 [Cryptococcus amylolentus CBS 6039]ODN84854.1 hypothetical protein L202_00712 [Cryptococcus amylolentus CBS 6039]
MDPPHHLHLPAAPYGKFQPLVNSPSATTLPTTPVTPYDLSTASASTLVDGRHDYFRYRAEPPAAGAIEISRWRFWAIFGSLCIVVFLFALDQLIVATALPKITAEFDALSQMSWISSGYFLTLLSFNLLYSQFMNIFPSKHVMIFAILGFNAGSLVCGLAPNMTVLIIGRVISGAGAAGLFGSGMVIIAELTPLHSRGQYFSGFGICFAIASVVGPLLGGTFSDHVTWRWCFYINLPLGAVTIVSILLFQPSTPPLGLADTYTGYSWNMLKQVLLCDWVGVCLSTAWGTCFILAAQWAGVSKHWNNYSVIICWVGTGVLPFVFCLYEWFRKDKGYFRIRLLSRRNIGGAAILGFFTFGLYMILVFYLSLTFQSVHQISATGAGIRLLPLIGALVAFLIISALLISRFSRYKAVICAGPILLIAASVLFSTINSGTSLAKLYGYQVILGAGLGCCMQNIMLAVQNELRHEPAVLSMGTGLAVFVGFAGRILGLNVAQSVFENMLQRNLRSQIPTISSELIASIMNDAASVWTVVPDQLRPDVLKAWCKTASEVFMICIPLAVLALVGGLVMKNSRMATKEEEEEEKHVGYGLGLGGGGGNGSGSVKYAESTISKANHDWEVGTWASSDKAVVVVDGPRGILLNGLKNQAE